MWQRTLSTYKKGKVGEMLTSSRFTVRTVRRRGVEAGINLTKRRMWYADNDEGGKGSDSQEGQSNGGGSGASEVDLSDVESVRKAYEELRKENASLMRESAERRVENKQLSERLDNIEKARTKQLAEQGNYEALAKERAEQLATLAPFKERAEALEQRIRASNDAMIERIPEDMRKVVPVNYTPEQLAEWLESNLSLLTKAPAPPLDGGAGGGSGKQAVTVTDADRTAAEIARRNGYVVTPEDIAKRRGK